MLHPDVILDDPRCTPDDTPTTWALKVLWPRALADPTPIPATRAKKDLITMAERWAVTERHLRVSDPQGLRCKACGASDTPNNPLLWGNPEIAKAHGVRIREADISQMFFAQSADWKSGDTDITLIGYSPRAPMIYCLACTIGLSTRVANVLIRPHLAFFWTPRHEALPWDLAPALWELPPERPLIVRTARGPGKNNEKWFMTLTITWDPAVIVLPVVDRDTMRGVFPVALSVRQVQTWPAQFRDWMATRRQRRQPTNDGAFGQTLWPELLADVPAPFRTRILLKRDEVYSALKRSIQEEEAHVS